ncbi:hypothetical protein JD276_12910 [Leucobacter sp. CSA1]|uniref:HTH luxR-type domain-containing protein n=1 Tax=Leucobacter chromiisoli TaxID=2796471 RepID=A0A934UVW6_9MICO|nr:LuxR C-terminal-related transcriptional regulator [Leucobacter chromiisoli]MBK0419931.1 hypothetical protein [Leucobacter chromiisoli]
MDAAARVVVLRAEGGAGKTVLAAHWARETDDFEVVWVGVDEGTREPRSFWLRTFSAVGAVLGGRHQDLAAEYLSGLIPTDEAPALLASVLIRDPRPIALVFDDLHLASEETQDRLVSLVGRVPELRVVVTTRQRTGFETPTARTALDVEVIGSRELAFTAAELAGLAQRLPYRLAPSELSLLRRATRGHPLATQLALSVVRTLSRNGSRRPGREEIARGVEAAVTDFLPAFDAAAEEQLATAVALCPEVDEPLAAALGGERAWTAIASMEERGLGRFAARAGRQVFLMHTLVASALRHRAAQTLGPDELTRVRRIAYEHLRELADPIDLLVLLVEGGLDTMVFPHFIRHFSELSLHRTHDLIALLGPLPPARLEREGTLPIVLATALSEHSVVPAPRAKKLVRTGLAALPERAVGESPLDDAYLLLARLAALRVLRRYDAAADVGERLLERLETLDASGVGGGWFPAKVQIAFTHLLALRTDRVRELGAALDEDPHPTRPLHFRSLLAFADAFAGDLPAAERSLTFVEDGMPATWPDSHYATGWRLASALRAAADGGFDDALALLEPLESRLAVLDLWPAVLWTRGAVRFAQGALARGLRELEAGLAETRTYPIGRGWSEQLHALLAEYAMASGDLARATSVLQASGADPAVQLSRARLALRFSRPQEALAVLNGTASADYLPAQEAQRALLRAVAQDRLGNSELASARADEGCYALGKLQNPLPLAFLPAQALDDLRRLTSRALWREPAGPPVAHDGPMLEPLTAREQLVLRALEEGRPLAAIAAELHVSLNTIKSQTRSIYRKLHVSGRREAVTKAAQLDLL